MTDQPTEGAANEQAPVPPTTDSSFTGSYGQTPPPPQYGQAPTPPQYAPQPGWQNPLPVYAPIPKDSGAVSAMIVGICGLVFGFSCGIGFFASPVAMVMGLRSKRRIKASGGQLSGEGEAQSGFVLGLIGTVLLGLAVLAIVAFIVCLVVFGTEWLDDTPTTDYPYGYSAT